MKRVLLKQETLDKIKELKQLYNWKKDTTFIEKLIERQYEREFDNDINNLKTRDGYSNYSGRYF